MNMRYACYGNLRIEPQPGAVGICQICKNKVRACCGTINKWHWRHNKLPDCDSFHEPMTEWHKDWQNQFPKDWQEVVLERNNEKHFADVLTPNNLVIEFQHSSISPLKILERELFYNHMIWVVNAVGFKKNLNINDLLEANLKKLKEFNKSVLHSEISNLIDGEISLLRSELLGLENKLNRLPKVLDRRKETLKTYEKTLQNLDEYLSNEAFVTWLKNGRILNAYSEQLDMNEVEIRKQIIDLHQKIDYNTNQIVQIDVELKDNGLIIQNKDLKEKLEILKTEIQKKIRDQKKSLQEIQNEVKSIFLEGLPDLIEKESSEIRKIEVNLPKINQEIISKNLHVEHVKKTKKDRISEFLVKKNLEFQQEMIRIKKKHENIFSYEWKNKRKSWEYASKPIFLDFGDEYLFKIKSNNLLERVAKNYFIKYYSNH